MRQLLFALALLLLSGCAAPAAGTPEPPPEAPAEEELSVEEIPAETEIPVEEVLSEDHVLLTLDAPLADGRVLRLEAVGKPVDESTVGVREVRVYDGDALLQTVSVFEAVEWEWGSAADDLAGEYTSCWTPEETMEVLDLNFDGNTDFGLFGWTANNTIPYYYWLWNAGTGRYEYAFLLQGAEAHPETKEVTSEYKSGSAGSQWITKFYRPDEEGGLFLHRLERITLEYQPASGSLDTDRGGAVEIWVPPEGDGPFRLGPGGGMEAVDSRANGMGNLEDSMNLVRREVPVCEVKEDGTVSRFTEIWEFWDGEGQLVERKEYAYENRP